MKKLLILMGAIIAGIVALSLTGPLIGFAISASLVFLGMHYYVKSSSAISKVLWVFVGLIGLSSAISNIPALIGLGALIILYILYKKWKQEDVTFNTSKEEDPFKNFENEWAKLTK